MSMFFFFLMREHRRRRKDFGKVGVPQCKTGSFRSVETLRHAKEAGDFNLELLKTAYSKPDFAWTVHGCRFVEWPCAVCALLVQPTQAHCNFSVILHENPHYRQSAPGGGQRTRRRRPRFARGWVWRVCHPALFGSGGTSGVAALGPVSVDKHIWTRR